MQRKESFVEGEFYHLYNRGNTKQNIFVDDEDRRRFVKLLFLLNTKKSINFREDIVKRKKDVWEFDRGEPIISIGAWVLMPNHFHLLVTIPQTTTQKSASPKSDLGLNDKKNGISTFMQKVFTAYSKYFNTKHERTGALFECNFKSTVADYDQYMKYLFSYIHMNPVKLFDKNWKEKGVQDIGKAKKFLDNYEWSSYQDYCGKERIESKILAKKDFPEYFSDPQIFEKEIFDWLSFNEYQLQDPALSPT